MASGGGREGSPDTGETVPAISKRCCCPSASVQTLAPRFQPEAFHRLVLLLEAIVGSLQFAIGCARLIKLALQVAELNFRLVELLENATMDAWQAGKSSGI